VTGLDPTTLLTNGNLDIEPWADRAVPQFPV